MCASSTNARASERQTPNEGLQYQKCVVFPAKAGIHSVDGSARTPACARVTVTYWNRYSLFESNSGRPPVSAAWGVLAEDALQGAPMHLEAARGFRHVALAQFEDPLDVLPAHPVGRHRVFGRLRRAVILGQ
jgi:hypothetical protein